MSDSTRRPLWESQTSGINRAELTVNGHLVALLNAPDDHCYFDPDEVHNADPDVLTKELARNPGFLTGTRLTVFNLPSEVRINEAAYEAAMRLTVESHLPRLVELMNFPQIDLKKVVYSEYGGCIMCGCSTALVTREPIRLDGVRRITDVFITL
jgi:hypothetical protein